jgi:hypothetical protein
VQSDPHPPRPSPAAAESPDAREGRALPPQAAAPSTRGSAAGWNGFGVGSWPSGLWRPYSGSSPFNVSAVGAVVHPDSAGMVQRVLSWNAQNPVGNLLAGTADTSVDYAHPTFYSQPSDPIFTLHATGGSPSIEGVRIPVPDAARAAGGADHHMAIVTPDGWEYDLWNVISKPRGGGTLTFELGGRTRIDGNGLDSYGTAARFGNLGGVIRAQELAAGRIEHALFITLKCTSTSTGFGYGTRPAPGGGQSAFVYPASHGGSSCSSADNAGAPPMGARFQLAMSDAQIQALGVPVWKKTILTALAHYGGYVGDTGGPGFAFQFESGTTYTSFGVADPLVTFAKANNLPTYNGTYVFNMATGVDWGQYLRVLTPPPAA